MATAASPLAIPSRVDPPSVGSNEGSHEQSTESSNDDSVIRSKNRKRTDEPLLSSETDGVEVRSEIYHSTRGESSEVVPSEVGHSEVFPPEDVNHSGTRDPDQASRQILSPRSVNISSTNEETIGGTPRSRVALQAMVEMQERTSTAHSSTSFPVRERNVIGTDAYIRERTNILMQHQPPMFLSGDPHISSNDTLGSRTATLNFGNIPSSVSTTSADSMGATDVEREFNAFIQSIMERSNSSIQPKELSPSSTGNEPSLVDIILLLIDRHDSFPDRRLRHDRPFLPDCTNYCHCPPNRPFYPRMESI